ncbi:MAG: right-handed parallel beta-helix repeat-containing protein [Planctomycetales bacterium]|nr:right-handed parallel beta-helix repeat-containing protein [Planctomycetales bacterium]
MLIRPQIVIPLVLSLFTILCPANAATYYVRMTGSDADNGHSKQHAFRTIQKAVTSATSNDTIYIGAGTYSESVYKSFGSSPKTISIFGDPTGAQTDDSGEVIIEAPDQQWGLRIYYAKSVEIANIHFTAQLDNGKSHGCYLYRTEDSNQVSNCVMTNLYHGAYSYQSGSSLVQNCTFNHCYMAAYDRFTNTSVVNTCQFDNCTYGFYVNDVPDSRAQDCVFQGSLNEDGTHTANYPIRVYRSGFEGVNLIADKPVHAILGSDIEKLTVSNLTVTQPSGWGINAQGKQLTATDVTVTGIGDRKGWGVTLIDKDGNKSSLKNVTTSALYGGIMSNGSEYLFDNVRSSSNYIGLYVAANTPSFSLQADTPVEITDNVLGFYAVHSADAKGDIDIDGYDFVNNDYGLYAVRTNTRIRNCNFADNARGAWITQADTADVKSCSFKDNIARNTQSHFGLYIQSAAVKVDDCRFERNDTGLYVYNTSETESSLSNLTLIDNSYMGLRTNYGKLKLTGNSKIVISGSTYGIYSQFTDCDLDGIAAPTGATYPLTNVDGALILKNVDIGEGRIGVYAVRNTSLVIQNTEVHDQEQHGFYINQPASVQIADCKSYSNSSHGLYCNWPGDGDKDFSVSNSTFAGNNIGYRTIGVPFDAQHTQGLTVTDNNHGLRIEQSTLNLTANANLVSTRNNYAVMCYYGAMNVEGVAIRDNQVGLYNWDSTLTVSDLDLAVSDYGIISYAGVSEVSDLTVNGGRYGVYFSPRTARGNTLYLRNAEFNNLEHIGVYVYSVPDFIADAQLENISVVGGNYGVYTYNSKVNANGVVVDSINNYGIYQNLGQANYTGVAISNTGSWGVVTYGDSFVLNRAKVNSRYGVYLRSVSGQVLNSVIQNSVYGVYTNRDDGQYQVLQSTIGNISHYGVLHNAGTLTLRNSIVDAGVYALWNRSQTGSLEHDHNLIVADRRSYVNELPGENEIEKQPIFLDPAAGDLHLAAGSPAINVGLDLSEVSVSDIEGNARPSFRNFELGAYEFTDKAGSLRILDWEEKAN